MIDTLFTIGQAASALLMLYGGYLVLMPARAARRSGSAIPDHTGGVCDLHTPCIKSRYQRAGGALLMVMRPSFTLT